MISGLVLDKYEILLLSSLRNPSFHAFTLLETRRFALASPFAIASSLAAGPAMRTRIVGMSIEEIEKAAKLVLEGRLIAYPTDTVYGLGCNPFDSDAVDRLVKAKERLKGSLPILVSSLKDAKRLGEISGLAAT